MTAFLVAGKRTWKMRRDGRGHRTYTVESLIQAGRDDGPFVVLSTPGLSQPGDPWIFLEGEYDPWAFCTAEADVTPEQKKGDPTQYWRVIQTFTTLPQTRCQDTRIEDPLLEPADISGSFVKYTKEVTEDRNGIIQKSSSHEPFKGRHMEFDHNRPTVIIKFNTAILELALFTSMIDKVNDAPLWGLPVRTIKLSNTPWQRKVYGSCNYYYTMTYEFDIDFSTFDRDFPDQGTKVLDDTIPGADKDNPDHFRRYTDKEGNPTTILLDGNGNALVDGNAPVIYTVEYYKEANFLLLGIPTSL